MGVSVALGSSAWLRTDAGMETCVGGGVVGMMDEVELSGLFLCLRRAEKREGGERRCQFVSMGGFIFAWGQLKIDYSYVRISVLLLHT